MSGNKAITDNRSLSAGKTIKKTNKSLSVKIENSARFTKEQLVHSGRYRKDRDLLNVLLSEDRTYTKAEVEKMIVTFQKGTVN